MYISFVLAKVGLGFSDFAYRMTGFGVVSVHGFGEITMAIAKERSSRPRPFKSA